uniref:SHR-BD domain-containing protein n=1 Tax=Macrostomum lignano TaxID=282301 RepID=A0A1I8FGG8_9PLAT
WDSSPARLSCGSAPAEAARRPSAARWWVTCFGSKGSSRTQRLSVRESGKDFSPGQEAEFRLDLDGAGRLAFLAALTLCARPATGWRRPSTVDGPATPRCGRWPNHRFGLSSCLDVSLTPGLLHVDYYVGLRCRRTGDLQQQRGAASTEPAPAVEPPRWPPGAPDGGGDILDDAAARLPGAQRPPGLADWSGASVWRLSRGSQRSRRRRPTGSLPRRLEASAVATRRPMMRSAVRGGCSSVLACSTSPSQLRQRRRRLSLSATPSRTSVWTSATDRGKRAPSLQRPTAASLPSQQWPLPAGSPARPLSRDLIDNADARDDSVACAFVTVGWKIWRQRRRRQSGWLLPVPDAARQPRHQRAAPTARARPPASRWCEQLQLASVGSGGFGDLGKISLQLDSHRPEDQVHLASLRLSDLEQPLELFLPAGLQPGAGQQAEFNASRPGVPQAVSLDYRPAALGSARNCGSSAVTSMRIVLHGDLGSSAPGRAAEPAPAARQTVSRNVRCLSVGHLHSVTIGHEQRGGGQGVYLDSVSVSWRRSGTRKPAVPLPAMAGQRLGRRDGQTQATLTDSAESSDGEKSSRATCCTSWSVHAEPLQRLQASRGLRVRLHPNAKDDAQRRQPPIRCTAAPLKRHQLQVDDVNDSQRQRCLYTFRYPQLPRVPPSACGRTAKTSKTRTKEAKSPTSTELKRRRRRRPSRQPRWRDAATTAAGPSRPVSPSCAAGLRSCGGRRAANSLRPAGRCRPTGGGQRRQRTRESRGRWRFRIESELTVESQQPPAVWAALVTPEDGESSRQRLGGFRGDGVEDFELKFENAPDCSDGVYKVRLGLELPLTFQDLDTEGQLRVRCCNCPNLPAACGQANCLEIQADWPGALLLPAAVYECGSSRWPMTCRGRRPSGCSCSARTSSCWRVSPAVVGCCWHRDWSAATAAAAPAGRFASAPWTPGESGWVSARARLRRFGSTTSPVADIGEAAGDSAFPVGRAVQAAAEDEELELQRSRSARGRRPRPAGRTRRRSASGRTGEARDEIPTEVHGRDPRRISFQSSSTLRRSRIASVSIPPPPPRPPPPPLLTVAGGSAAGAAEAAVGATKLILARSIFRRTICAVSGPPLALALAADAEAAGAVAGHEGAHAVLVAEVAVTAPNRAAGLAPPETAPRSTAPDDEAPHRSHRRDDYQFLMIYYE